MIEFKHINKTFFRNGESTYALKDINLTINEGDIFGVIGFSGAGKSTLIRLVNSLEQPSSGDVIIDGAPISGFSSKELRDAKKNIGMIFQHFNLLQTKTVAQNIALPLTLTGVDKATIDKRVEELLDFVELPQKKNAYPHELSGGQKQRVGIARALASQPKILLCDEATSALDPQTTQSILQLLKKINKEQNITIMIVTHEMEVVKSICNRIAVMEQGQVIEEGSTLEIFGQPRHPTTQSFVETAINKDVPKNIIDRLSADQRSRIYRLQFLEDSVKLPLINELVLSDKITVNILYANMAEISGTTLGSMFVLLEGDEADIQEAIDFLESRHVNVSLRVE